VKRMDTAVVFDVQRFSIHDGPGIRTVVFFKGCALACEWCQNPEALLFAPQIAYNEEQCLAGCRACVAACDEEAARPQRTNRLDFARCTACGDCVAVCPTGALRSLGRDVEAAELLAEVQRDAPFYAASGGGITLSGGEPVLQAHFLGEFLPQAAAAGLHVALETAGAYPFDLLERILPWLDLVLFDVKLIDAFRHRRFTGRGNDQILANLRQLLATDTAVEVRMPVVPNRNTDAASADAMAAFLTGIGVGEITLLPYNHLWEAKLPRLGIDRPPLGIRPPDDACYTELQAELARHGLAARI
jgi:pyruvate formate lyase activating enzyme